MIEHLTYAEQKFRTRRNRQRAAAAEFSAGFVASGFAIAAGATVGLGWVPIVGWSIAAAAAAIGLGLGAYKVGRASYKYYRRQRKADRLIKDLLAHEPDAIAFIRDEFGAAPFLLIRQIKEEAEGKSQVKPLIYQRLRHKREHMAMGLKMALFMSNPERADATAMLLKLGFKASEISGLKDDGGEKRILRKLSSG